MCYPGPGKPLERKMIQMIQMIQMIVFSRFVFRPRVATIGLRVDCIRPQSAHPAGKNTGTENDSNDSNDPNDSNDCFLEFCVPDPAGRALDCQGGGPQILKGI